jgi:hypothetical protein
VTVTVLGPLLRLLWVLAGADLGPLFNRKFAEKRRLMLSKLPLNSLQTTQLVYKCTTSIFLRALTNLDAIRIRAQQVILHSCLKRYKKRHYES